MDRSKQPAVIAIVGSWNDREMNVAALQAIRNAGAAIFDQTRYPRRGALRRKAGRKLASTVSICWVLQPIRSAPALPALQRARTLTEQFGVLQQTAAAPQQILAFGCQFDPAADAIEQGNPELGLERLDLAGRRRLAQAQLLMSDGKASGFRNDDERTELSQIHFNAPIA